MTISYADLLKKKFEGNAQVVLKYSTDLTSGFLLLYFTFFYKNLQRKTFLECRPELLKLDLIEDFFSSNASGATRQNFSKTHHFT
ncbi:hypothetical protein BpHYR1_013992 [Brachionus plicatilis]|uniref:Uncharacterized protein n=1 Tax=Brachionus plicatilis TaxID=10195 RepID=A0A3M7SSY8_BRAPC|nr:hypothetical protein BpHYR1_013992 [Brachionus plicatilis]